MIFEAIPPAGYGALAPLGALAALFFIIGCIYVIHGFVTALFGLANRAVGWIPLAGRVVQLPLHKIEQKVTNALGTAERALDARIATSWHQFSSAVRRLDANIVASARLGWHIVSVLNQMLTVRDFWHFLRRAVIPLQIQGHRARHEAHTAHTTATGAQHTATHAEKGAQVVAARAASLERSRSRSRVAAREHAQDISIGRLWKWVRSRGRVIPAGVGLGVVAWALGRLGVSWIRCSNWKRLGRQVCQMPASRITSLLGLLAGVWAVTHIRTVAEYAKSISEEVARDLLKVAGAGDFPRDRFTIE